MASGETKKSRSAATEADAGLTFTRAASVEPTSNGRPLPVDRIIKGDRLRPADPAGVEAKRVSMRESGQIAPILVRPAPDQPGWYILVVGLHRLEAAIAEGWAEIRADIRQLTEDQARLIEVDENLIGPSLTPLERAVFIDVRLQVWARLHPERIGSEKLGQVDPISGTPVLRRGRPANSEKFAEFLGTTPPTMGFNAETAEDLGLSEKTVKRALAIARGLSPDTRAKVSGTKLAKNEGLLRQLAAVPDKGEQLRAAEALIGEKAKSFTDALLLAAGKTPAPPAPPRPADEAVAAFMAVWKKAPPTHQDAILHALSGQRLPKGWTVTKGAVDE